MNNDRIAGAAQTLAGGAIASIGRTIGDDRLAIRGDAHRRAGRRRNLIGSIRDILGIRAPDRATGGRLSRSPSFQRDDIMNEDEIKGGIRYVKGKIEKTAGDVATDHKWQVDGVVDQVAGGAQNLYGRAKDKVADFIDEAPGAIADAGERVRDVASQGIRAADTRTRDNPWAIVAVAGVAGYALSWLVHGTRR